MQIDIADVKAAAKSAGVPDHQMFLPATAPSGVGINEYYKTEEEYFHAFAAELSKEYRAIPRPASCSRWTIHSCRTFSSSRA